MVHQYVFLLFSCIAASAKLGEKDGKPLRLGALLGGGTRDGGEECRAGDELPAPHRHHLVSCREQHS
jgi:hypothetical protein